MRWPSRRSFAIGAVAFVAGFVVALALAWGLVSWVYTSTLSGGQCTAKLADRGNAIQQAHRTQPADHPAPVHPAESQRHPARGPCALCRYRTAGPVDGAVHARVRGARLVGDRQEFRRDDTRSEVGTRPRRQTLDAGSGVELRDAAT